MAAAGAGADKTGAAVFQGQRGRLRLVTLVIGFINLLITANKYSADTPKEEFYFAAVLLAFLFSATWTAILQRGGLGSERAELLKNSDPLAHLVLGILLLVATTFWTFSVRLDDPCEYLGYWAGCSRSRYYQRVAAGVLGALNGVAYTALAACVFTGRE